MDGTRIRLLGPVDLIRDGVPGDVPGRSRRTLLAVLSLRIDEIVSRDQLVDALWPGRQTTSIIVYHSSATATMPGRCKVKC